MKLKSIMCFLRHSAYTTLGINDYQHNTVIVLSVVVLHVVAPFKKETKLDGMSSSQDLSPKIKRETARVSRKAYKRNGEGERAKGEREKGGRK